ncbi:MAG TPA: GTP-binding protein, partial [Acidimicrobiales bacterium]|nr:GTP-binding protein [Acidimicrobiales bacterium]
MQTLNLGILAHVDAGKTTLTERLLYTAGVIDEIGSVDDGSTQTDTLDLERERGITIKAAVVSFLLGDLTVNLIDTPGHPDFIAEVERVLGVLDGPVLVVSAVEGVQAQSRILMRTLQRLRIPTIIFVNKIDRAGASCEATLEAIARRLTPAIVAMTSAADLGTKAASAVPFGSDDADFLARMAGAVADNDDAVIDAYVRSESSLGYDRLRKELAGQTKAALLHPVFFGSAITGAGIDALGTGIRELLPPEPGDAGAPAAASVFKIERGPAAERIAYLRMFAGTIRRRDRLHVGGKEPRVTQIGVFEHGSVVERPA